ncbi:hypothetical protein [Mycolicibacterium confluentis]|uniref:Uncharacterized protein n=1 Tax=Mycolicibacterium confluentis TaxID=28047 RepID=A0A7I7XZ29_9MYCO|nr:hypothetical protein [Mycolicibacterium confluentis]MCV7319536.1 hypothetical protein [Mycolicibacterium confluentis]ORV34161.1 hypothetical protein AWB99_00450 [Mycolicibacterium confluentis]BBZ34557.1 hypothetical protein MCNF_31620 [Mycolicibacterium confluentis]
MTVLESEATETEAPEAEVTETEAIETEDKPRNRGHVLVCVVLPLAVLAMALGVGYLKWQANSVSVSQGVAAQAVVAATEGAGAMLSYRADHVQEDLTAATQRMTGDFRNEYTTLINDLVIPGAEQKRISAVATVPAAALLSADADRAQVLVYVNQTTTVGADPPTDTRSSARVDLEKVGDRWLISGFEPL